jgi:5-amino-6-(5-phosphoribosylamino)uracil reductase
VTERPYVLLSCAISVDGCLDAPGPDRLILSGSADLDRVDEERARSDAIMVGAGTIRRDDPQLLIRSPARRAGRAARGLPEQPAGVTLTASGSLDPAARFFTAARSGAGPAAGGSAQAGSAQAGSAQAGSPAASGAEPGGQPAVRLVYCPASAGQAVRGRLAGLADVVEAGEPLRLTAVLADLARRGVRRLMVEGGASLGAQFLAGGLADELHLAVAPFFVGSPAAPRFAPAGSYPHGPSHPMVLTGVRRLGEVVLLRYLLGTAHGGTADGGTADGGAADGGAADG